MEMAKLLKTRRNRASLPATQFGPRPGDFPIGSLESRAAARALLVGQTIEPFAREMAELGNLTPFELAVGEGYSGLKRVCAVRFARMAEEKAKVFGHPLLAPEQIRHAREVARVADELAGGRLFELSFSNPVEAKRWRALAEEELLKCPPKPRGC